MDCCLNFWLCMITLFNIFFRQSPSSLLFVWISEMKHDNFIIQSIRTIHLYCYIPNISAVASFSFIQVFHVEFGAHKELRTEPFIQSSGVDCSNSIYKTWYKFYSLLFNLYLGMNLQPPDDFTEKHSSTKIRYSLRQVPGCTVRVRRETPEESWRTHRPKRREYNNEDE